MKTPALRTVLFAIVSLAAGLALSGCNSARVERTWTNPDVKHITYQRLFVNAGGTDEARRSAVELAIAKALPSTVVVPGHTVLKSPATLEQLKAAVAASKSDGLAIIRLVSDREVKGTIPGEPVPVYPASIDAYWSANNQFVIPAIPSNNRVVTINVSLYDVASGRLQWSGTLESINPSSATDLGGEIAKAVSAKLRSQGLVK